MESINNIIASAIEKGLELQEKSFDGMFLIDRKRGRTIIASWGAGWEHVSINDFNITPTWEEMCELKDIFWDEDECVVQYHPPQSEYVNNLQHCLHLWKPIEEYVGKLPIPDKFLVGIKGIKLDRREQE